MSRSRVAAFSLYIVVALFLPTSLAYATGKAADAQCPKPDDTHIYNTKYTYPQKYKEKDKEIQSLWRKPCEDSFVKGFCTSDNFCDAEQSGSQCFSNGKWGPCALPSESQLKGGSGQTPESTAPGTTPSATGLKNPDGSQATIGPGSSVLQSALESMSNPALNQPSSQSTAEGTSPWDNPGSAESFKDFISQQNQIGQGAGQQTANQDTSIGGALQRWGADFLHLDGGSQSLTPVNAAGEFVGESIQTHDYNPSGATGFGAPSDTAPGGEQPSFWEQTAQELRAIANDTAEAMKQLYYQVADGPVGDMIAKAQQSIGLTPTPEATKISVDAKGNIDPVEFYKAAVEKFGASSLNGYAPEWGKKFGIDGSPESWARFATQLAAQESQMRVADVNSDGSLRRFETTLPGEQSYGPLQFNKGQYGLNEWSDVNDPGKNIDALIRVAEQGKMEAYFGPVQRPSELTQHASWFNNNVAPYVQQTGGPTNFASNNSSGVDFASVPANPSYNPFTEANTGAPSMYSAENLFQPGQPTYNPNGNYQPAESFAAYEGNPWSSTGNNSLPPEFSYNGLSPEAIYNSTGQGQRENAALALENTSLYNQGPGFTWSPPGALSSEQVFGGPTEGAGALQDTSSFDNITVQTLQGTPVGGESSVPVPDTWTPSGQALTQEIYNETEQGKRETAALSWGDASFYDQPRGLTFSPPGALSSEQILGGPAEGAGALQTTSSFNDLAIRTLPGTSLGGENSVPVPDTWTPSGQALTQDIYNATEQGKRENAALALENTSLYNQGPGFTWSPASTISSEQAFGGPSEGVGTLQSSDFENVAVRTMPGTTVGGESSVPVPDTSIQSGEDVTASVFDSASNERIEQAGLESRLSEADRQWEAILTSASNPPKEFSSFYDAVGISAGNTPEPIAISGEGGPTPVGNTPEPIALSGEGGPTPIEGNTPESIALSGEGGPQSTTALSPEERLAQAFEMYPGDIAQQVASDRLDTLLKENPQFNPAHTWQPEVTPTPAGNTPEPIAVSGEGGPTPIEGNTPEKLALSGEGGSQPNDTAKVTPSNTVAPEGPSTEPIQNPPLPRERPNAFSYDAKSDIGKKGVDSNEFMSKAIPGYDKLSPLAQAQAKDALGSALADNPDVAKQLGATGVRNGEAVFPDRGNINLDALKNSDFQKDFADTIKSDEKTLTRELGGNAKVEAFANSAGQSPVVPKDNSNDFPALQARETRGLSTYVPSEASDVPAPASPATQKTLEQAFPEAQTTTEHSGGGIGSDSARASDQPGNSAPADASPVGEVGDQDQALSDYLSQQEQQQSLDNINKASNDTALSEVGAQDQALSAQKYLEEIEQNEFLNAAGTAVSPEVSAAEQQAQLEQDRFLDAVGSDVSPEGGQAAEILAEPKTDLTSLPEDTTVPEIEKGTRCASESCVGGEIGDSRSRPLTPEQQALQDKIDQQKRDLSKIRYDDLVQVQKDIASSKTSIPDIKAGLTELNKALNSLGMAGDRSVMANGLAEAKSLAKDLRDYGGHDIANRIDSYVRSVPQISSLEGGRIALNSGNGIVSEASSYLNGQSQAAQAQINQYSSLQSQINSNTSQLQQLSVQESMRVVPQIPSNWASGSYTPSQAAPSGIPPLGNSSWTRVR